METTLVAPAPEVTPETAPAPKDYQPVFHGTGGDLLSIKLTNAILMVLTLGVYFPWARLRNYRFLWSNTEIGGSRFRFTGTAREIFSGFVKVAAFILLFLYGPQLLTLVSPVGAAVASVILYVLGAWLYQFAYFASRRYRYSRTTLREIRFHLDGSAKEFTNQAFAYLLGAAFSFYYLLPRYLHYRWEYVFNNLRFGNVRFSFDGDRNAFWPLGFWGQWLTLLTLGIYSFWYAPRVFNYWVGHVVATDGEGNTSRFSADVQPGDFFRLKLGNFFLIALTLGLGAPWAMVRNLRFYLSHIRLHGTLDIDRAIQIALQDSSAGGDLLGDQLDVGGDLAI